MLSNHILQEFHNKKIFVTGGTGFFGKSILSYIKRYFLDINTSWTILSREPQKFLTNYPEFNNLHNIHFIQGDVRNFSYKPCSDNKKPERYVPNTGKIQKELNVKQTVNLEEAILLSC